MFAGKPSGKFPEGRVRDLLGKLAGMSGRTLAKARQGTRTDLKHGGKLPPSKVLALAGRPHGREDRP
jgi:hypothetical protein